MTKKRPAVARESAERTVMASDFKARCLSLLDWVSVTGNPLTVTKRGKPVARLVPLEEAEDDESYSIFGSVHDLTDDPTDLYSTGEVWEIDTLDPNKR